MNTMQKYLISIVAAMSLPLHTMSIDVDHMNNNAIAQPGTNLNNPPKQQKQLSAAEKSASSRHHHHTTRTS